MRFLMRCQITDGPHAGALPRVIQGFRPATQPPADAAEAGEIRIDYVQHALSAMLLYDAAMARTPHAEPPARTPH